jgi:isoleucyl-tRNA synthetase
VTKLVAPFVPFLAETLWSRLTEPFDDRVLKSVHWCDYPQPLGDRVDQKLSTSMKLLREITSLGRAARAEAKLKVRLPLAKVEVVLADDSEIAWLQEHDELVRDELNVKAVDYTTEGDEYVQYTVVPNFKRLGPKVGKQVPAVKAALAAADGNSLLSALQTDGSVTIELPDGSLQLDGDDIEVRLQARQGWAAAQGPGCVVVLNTEVTEELRREGIAKDLIRAIQNQRKEIDCQYSDRIEVGLVSDREDVQLAVEEHRESICKETLALRLDLSAIAGVAGIETEFGSVLVRKAVPS